MRIGTKKAFGKETAKNYLQVKSRVNRCCTKHGAFRLKTKFFGTPLFSLQHFEARVGGLLFSQDFALPILFCMIP